MRKRIENGGMHLKLGDIDSKTPYALESSIEGCFRKAAKVRLNLEGKMILVEVPWDIGFIK